MRLLTIGLTIFAAGCGEARTTGVQAADQYLAEKKLNVIDCGATTVSSCDSPTLDAVLTCLQDGALACQATRATITRPTVEGDPIKTTVIVEPECKFVVFYDTLADHFGPQQVTRETCSTLTVMPKGCPPVAGSGCGDKKTY